MDLKEVKTGMQFKAADNSDILYEVIDDKSYYPRISIIKLPKEINNVFSIHLNDFKNFFVVKSANKYNNFTKDFSFKYTK